MNKDGSHRDDQKGLAAEEDESDLEAGGETECGVGDPAHLRGEGECGEFEERQGRCIYQPGVAPNAFGATPGNLP